MFDGQRYSNWGELVERSYPLTNVMWIVEDPEFAGRQYTSAGDVSNGHFIVDVRVLGIFVAGDMIS